MVSMPSGARFHHQRGPPMRRVEGAKGAQRQQQPLQQQSTQPPPMPSTFYLPTLQQVQANGTLYPVNRHTWAVQSSTDGKLFQHSPFFLPLMTTHGASGPASFPPSYSTPNGNMQPPPEYMTMALPPSQKSPPPFPHQFMPPAKQNSPPHHYAHPYPQPLPASNHKESCFNCGAIGHRGGDCTDPSIQDVLKKGKATILFLPSWDRCYREKVNKKLSTDAMIWVISVIF